MIQDKLGDRMKAYEQAYETKLPAQTPVIIRVDGRAFHTLTKPLKEKPFDARFTEVMTATMLHLCEAVQNCFFGYVQSDEISLCCLEPAEDSTPFFDNRLEKIISIVAAEASTFFRERLSHYVPDSRYNLLLEKAIFDCRAFSVPKEEVNNYFIWRQKDCYRNAVLSLGQYYFSQKQITGLSTKEIVEKLQKEKSFNLKRDINSKYLYGRGGYKVAVEKLSKNKVYPEGILVTRYYYFVNEDLPDFSSDKNFIWNQYIRKEDQE